MTYDEKTVWLAAYSMAAVGFKDVANWFGQPLIGLLFALTSAGVGLVFAWRFFVMIKRDECPF